MVKKRSGRLWLLPSVLLLVTMCAHSQSAPGHSSTRYIPDRSNSAASPLQDAYATLVKAKPLYKGHRAKALRHIRSAMKLHDGEIASRGKDRETGGDSDARLRTAQRVLQQARSGLSSEGIRQVNDAIQEISLGLSERRPSRVKGASR